MKSNRILGEIRSTISPEMKRQMELSVAIANRIYSILEAKGMYFTTPAMIRSVGQDNQRSNGSIHSGMAAGGRNAGGQAPDAEGV